MFANNNDDIIENKPCLIKVALYSNVLENKLCLSSLISWTILILERNKKICHIQKC